MKSYAYGFPRLGKGREYKNSIEGFWNGSLSEQDLNARLSENQNTLYSTYSQYVDAFPSGEMTRYDHMLDTAVMVGAYRPVTLEEYYNYCRGSGALEMTKWFNTNYHYLIPDLTGISPGDLSLHWNRTLEASAVSGKSFPYLLGPYTFLKLSRGVGRARMPEFMEALGAIYAEAVSAAPDVHIDEPAFAMDVNSDEIALIRKTYEVIGSAGARIHLFTYYESVDFLKVLFDLPLASLGLDFVHGEGNINALSELSFPGDMRLIAGLVDGRNVWKNDIARSIEMLRRLSRSAGSISVSNAAPLYHVPVTIEGEPLEPGLLSRLSFALEKLQEIKLIAEGHEKGIVPTMAPSAPVLSDQKVAARIAGLGEQDFTRSSPYEKRTELQRSALNLPPFPTTTIGSFPQTAEVRKKRLDMKKGRISSEEYNAFIDEKIADLVSLQEELDIDVLVHGEFERSDMVEFFAEKLEGIATTDHGWVLSYGTRVYRPPIVHGDVSRPSPMTLREIAKAKSLTKKPVKGMLTGPVTILAWSYVREDVPVEVAANQIALCLRDEIADYEKNGIGIVQVDEPAFREKAPLKKRDWDAYFKWAVRAFRLATGSAADRTQVHTHMCYSRFGEIMDRIMELDFDVISIEASRSRGDIVESFEEAGFDRQIGLGCWDVHSPEVPTREGMREVAERALRVIPGKNFWINPDCGLKTRGWKESVPSLRAMVEFARELRKEKTI